MRTNILKKKNMKKDVTSIQGFLEFVYDFYKSMKENEINLIYEGEITHQITKAFTALTESAMEKDEEQNTVQRRVFHVMVECLQNINKHADVKEGSISQTGRGIFLVSKGAKYYSVTTGNIVSNSKKEELEELINTVNSLDREGLNKMYKEQIREGGISGKGGAGLGFIDIARKTGEKLDAHFLPVDENNSFFILTSLISRNI